MPTQSQAKKAWLHMAKGKPYYEAMSPEQKAAGWQYGRDTGLFDPNTADDYKKSEFSKYVKTPWTRYAPEITKERLTDTLKYDSHAWRQGAKVPLQETTSKPAMPTPKVTPKGIQGMLSKTPQQIAAIKHIPQKPVYTAAEYKSLPLSQKLFITPERVPERTQKLAEEATKRNVERAKTGLGAAGLGFTDATTLSTSRALGKAAGTGYKEVSDIARQEKPKSYIAGQVAGYIAPGATSAKLTAPLTKAATKGITNVIGKRIVEGAIAGAPIDVIQGYMEGERGKDLVGNVVRGAAYGAVGDAVLYGLGKAAQRIFKKLGKNATKEVAQAELEKMFKQGAIDGAERQKAWQELEDYYSTIEYLDEVNRSNPDYIKAETPYRKTDTAEQNFLKDNAVKSPTIEAKIPDDINHLPKKNIPATGQINAMDEAAATALKPEPKLKTSSLKKNWDKFYSATVDNTRTTAKVSKEAEIMSNVARNSGATVDHIIKKGLVNMEGKPLEGKAIADIFNLPENEAQALEDLLFETHNIDRVKQGKELTGRTTEESKLAIDMIKKQYPHLEEKAKEVNKLLKNMLDEWGVKSGLVGADLRNLVQNMYQNYVPGYRELGGVDAISFKSRGMGTAKIINKAIGGDDKLMSLQKSIPMLINKTVKAARKNELYQEILKAAEKGSPYAKIFEPVGKIEPVIEKNAANAMIEAIKADGIDALANITDNALTADPKLGYMLTVMKDGKPIKLQINEDLFKSLQALNGRGDDDLQAAIKLFKKTVTNPFKSLITGYNPLFAVRNLSRDLPTAYIQGTENNPIKFAKNLYKAGKDMIKNSDRFQEYKALGGEGGNYFNVEKGLKSEGKLEKVLKPLQAINNFTESLPRYGEYVGTLEREGADYATKMRALNNAQEVTVNFGRHGDVTKAIDAIVPYLNPAVQGLDKTARTFKKPEAWAKALGIITVPTAAIYAINQVVDKKGYDQLDDRTKDTYFVFPTGDGKFVKIAKTRESGAIFGALFERILRQAEGQPDAFKNYNNTLKNNFLIQNPWTDNIASPLVSGIGYNKDFAGRDVVPQYMLNDKRSPRLQYDERTSEIAKEIGDKFNLSPKQIDYIIRSYGGIVANIIQPATTKGGNVVESAIVRPFTADAAYSNNVTNGFYEKLDKLKQAATDRNIKEGLPSKLLTPEEEISNLYQGMSKQISAIRDEITKLGSTDEARQQQQKLLDILSELNKPVTYREAANLKQELIGMANRMKRLQYYSK